MSRQDKDNVDQKVKLKESGARRVWDESPPEGSGVTVL